MDSEKLCHADGGPPELCACKKDKLDLGRYWASREGWSCRKCGGFVSCDDVLPGQHIGEAAEGMTPPPAPMPPPAPPAAPMPPQAAPHTPFMFQRVQAYLAELVAVGRRHGFTLSHEDCHGGFLVDVPSEDNEGWLGAARPDAELKENPAKAVPSDPPTPVAVELEGTEFLVKPPPGGEDEPDSYNVGQAFRPDFVESASRIYDRLVEAHRMRDSLPVEFVPSAIHADLDALAKGETGCQKFGRAFLRLAWSPHGEGSQVILLVVRAERGDRYSFEAEVPH